jgi:hypothetical protein
MDLTDAQVTAELDRVLARLEKGADLLFDLERGGLTSVKDYRVGLPMYVELLDKYRALYDEQEKRQSAMVQEGLI